MLGDGSLSSFRGWLFTAAESSTKRFSIMTRISVAAPLTSFEGDEQRPTTGNINKSSSLKALFVLPTTYSGKSIIYQPKKESKIYKM